MTRRSVIATLFLAFAALLWTPASAQQQNLNFAKGTVKIVKKAGGRHTFNVEIARSPAQRRQGLMFRERMAADAGMLFDYQQAQPISMWMKNTYIPLDMIFIDQDGIISHISERAVPLSLQPISSNGPVRAVLEVNGGIVDRFNIKVGDEVRHKIFGNHTKR